MSDHIAKPLRVAEMFACMARWIGPRLASSGREAPSPGEVTRTTEPGPMGDIPGIDSAAGLATTQDNRALYRRLLVRFAEGQAEFASAFKLARADADQSAATRCAHTLKGVAASIGATRVAGAAALLEHACARGEAAIEIERLARDVVVALAPVVAGIRARMAHDDAEAATQADAPPAPPLQVAEVRDALMRLRVLLRENDADASDHLDVFMQRLAAAGHPLVEDLVPVARAVSDIDFDRALAALDSIEA